VKNFCSDIDKTLKGEADHAPSPLLQALKIILL
jgi:hypothetical protein